MSPSFGTSGRLNFVIFAYPGYFYDLANGGRAYSVYPVLVLVCVFVCVCVCVCVYVCVCVCYQNRVRSVTLLFLDKVCNFLVEMSTIMRLCRAQDPVGSSKDKVH